jgi:hypothetical protein
MAKKPRMNETIVPDPVTKKQEIHADLYRQNVNRILMQSCGAKQFAGNSVPNNAFWVLFRVSDKLQHEHISSRRFQK